MSPAAAAASPPMTEAPTYAAAAATRSCRSSPIASHEKVENVVNAPRKPTPSAATASRPAVPGQRPDSAADEHEHHLHGPTLPLASSM